MNMKQKSKSKTNIFLCFSQKYKELFSLGDLERDKKIEYSILCKEND